MKVLRAGSRIVFGRNCAICTANIHEPQKSQEKRGKLMWVILEWVSDWPQLGLGFYSRQLLPRVCGFSGENNGSSRGGKSGLFRSQLVLHQLTLQATILHIFLVGCKRAAPARPQSLAWRIFAEPWYRKVERAQCLLSLISTSVIVVRQESSFMPLAGGPLHIERLTIHLSLRL